MSCTIGSHQGASRLLGFTVGEQQYWPSLDRQTGVCPGVPTDRCVEVYRVAWHAAALQSELAVVLFAATLVLPDLLTALVVRQVQHLVSPTQLLHLQDTQVGSHQHTVRCRGHTLLNCVATLNVSSLR